MATYVYEDALDPDALRIDIAASNSLPDLSVVTTANIIVLASPTGALPTWSAVLSNQTATTLRVSHVFALGDVATPGTYRLLVRLYVGSVLHRCIPVPLLVKSLVA